MINAPSPARAARADRPGPSKGGEEKRRKPPPPRLERQPEWDKTGEEIKRGEKLQELGVTTAAMRDRMAERVRRKMMTKRGRYRFASEVIQRCVAAELTTESPQLGSIWWSVATSGHFAAQ